MLVVHDFTCHGFIKQLTFTIVKSVHNVQLPSTLYVFLLFLQDNGHGMKIVLVIDTSGHFKIVMNKVLIFVLINKALSVFLCMEVKAE